MNKVTIDILEKSKQGFVIIYAEYKKERKQFDAYGKRKQNIPESWRLIVTGVMVAKKINALFSIT